MPEFKLIKTGNEEFDVKIGGGIPYPSLILIEGGHGTGKTALSLLFLKGALDSGLSSVVFTSESRPSDYVFKASASGFPIETHYIKGKLRVFSIQYPGELNEELANTLLLRLKNGINKYSQDYDFFVIDSLSYLGAVASQSLLNDIVVTLRKTSSKKGMVVTVHPDSLPKDIMTDLAASADGYFKITPAVIGGRRLKVLSIIKLRGAPPGIDTTITFDVDPAFGIKLVPIMISQA